jgi:hypothetical protein
VLGSLDQYTKFQTANAIPDAAKNPGGLAGAGMGLAAGVAMGGQLAGQLAGAAQPSASPPPLPQSGFYVGIGGQQQGPFDAATLAARARDGSLTRATLVWKPGMANWLAAEAVPELQAMFANVPPPLPK